MAMKKVSEKELDTLELEVPKEELPRVSLEGCETVRRQFLSHLKANILTIRPDGIICNNACITGCPMTSRWSALMRRRKMHSPSAG
jgi:hypothetical protein